MRIDQLVFGYDGGHRLLGGSHVLTAESVSVLLGATDADPGQSAQRITAGVPLIDDDAYAVAVTWHAPEIARPGAVWSHVLVVANEHLAWVHDPFELANVARRPSIETLPMFQHSLDIDLHPVGALSVAPDELVGAVLSAAFVPNAPRRIEVKDLQMAERAIAAVWQVQWPALLSRFEFYTRDTSGGIQPRSGVILARRLRGQRPAPLEPAPGWVPKLAREAASGRAHGQIGSFIATFGPTERASPSALAYLAELSEAVSEGAVERVQASVETRYPDEKSGAQLKLALFGTGQQHWSATELDRLNALVGSTIEAWDLASLKVGPRLVTYLRSNALRRTLPALSRPGRDTARTATATSLALVATPKDVDVMFAWDADAAVAALRQNSMWLEDVASWYALSSEQARTVVAELPLSTPAVRAAARAGQIQVLADARGHTSVLDDLADASDFETAAILCSHDSWAQAGTSSPNDRVVLLAGSVLGGRPTDRLLEVLEASRSAPDELWLRAASAAIGSGKRLKRVLQTTFGPLHHSITANTLPRECWRDLDRVLPDAHDPALRLRRYLVRTARSDRWTEDDLAAALRDAGPFAAEILHDVSDDEWWASATKSILKSFGLFRGHSS